MTTSALRALWLVLGGLFWLAACSDAETPPAAVASGVETGSICPASSTLTYDNWGLDFFGRYCLRCHSVNKGDGERSGAPTGYNWDDIDSVRAHADDIDLMAAASEHVVNHEMPPSDPAPPTSERRKLGQWLACGAP